MARFEITLSDGATTVVDDADTYQQEGPMTTFFATGGRSVIDVWSTRVASYRTAELRSVRRAASVAAVNVA